MEIKRRKSKKILVGDVVIGGNSPISIQSMTKTDTRDVENTVKQIKKLEGAGCEIIRVAVEDEEAAKAIKKIKAKIKIPLVADIHFHYRLAILAMENGADKIRLNPGNISKKNQVEEVVRVAKKYKVPIRIGLNSGSVKRKEKSSLVNDLIDAGRSYLDIFKELNFDQIILSLKTPDILTTVEAYRCMAKLTAAPLHLGITAAGLPQEGMIKSSIGIGALLLEGIGDTLRVSLTSEPEEEVEVAKKILSFLNLRKFGLEIISCPACGRCNINLINVVKMIQKRLARLRLEYPNKKLKVAIMGCVVNGPQEAKEADIGVAWGGKVGILFKKGQKIKLVKENELINTLVAEVENEVVADNTANT